jgi:UDP-2,3-diacylglucosamine hydrolase
MREWLYISDLHLAPERPQIIQLFERFVDEVAINSDRLYILGDFLEYWLGDDDNAEGLDNAFSALERLSKSGTNVFFMHGNRDFLVGDLLAKRCQFKIIFEPLVENINNQPVLLMHGDSLCTDDIEYQKFRNMVRNKKWQDEQLVKPLVEREKIAKSLREQSQLANASKSPDIMDVNQNAVVAAMKEHNVSLMIHGHTHRPAIHEFKINGKEAKRIVLGDWYETGSYLRITEDNKMDLITFS